MRAIRSWSLLFVLALVNKPSFKVSGANLCIPPCLLVSNTSDIIAIDYKTSTVTSVVTGLSRAVAIDVHFSLGYIFWSDVIDQNIKRFRIGGSTTTIITGIGVCCGLAVHWRTSMLYWTDQSYDKISVSDIDGNNQGTLINSGLDAPRDIALDPDNGLIIWTDVGTYPKIEKASLSGNQRVIIVTTHLYQPNGIELDKGNKRIFWVDAGYDSVETVDYNGNNRKKLFQLDGLYPYGVALIAPFMFFTDWNTYQEVHKLDATTGYVLRSYNISGGQPMGIVAYDSARQPLASSPCAINNGGCSHFCVTKRSGYECVCSTGLTVKQDGKTCEDRIRKFILFADADDKSTNFISLDVSYFISQTLFNHLGNQRPIALDFDPVEDRVYWSDVYHGRIFSAFSNATLLKTLFHCNVQRPDGLAIDHVGRNIYWTDTGTKRIEVGRLDGTRRRVVIKDGLDQPRAIVLHERNGKMYWTDWGAYPKIEQAEMDGSARQTIVIGNLAWPNGLTIDQATNRLFWADAKLDKIESSDLTGGNRQLILSSSTDIHPYGLAVHQGMLYWTDWNTKSISRFNLSSRTKEEIVSGLQKPMDIHVFDPSLIFSGPHNCSLNNGLCSDFCLLKPGGYQCACPTGVKLKSDGKNCDYENFYKAVSGKFMIIAEAYVGEIYKVALEEPETPCFTLGINTNISSPVAVDYDPVEGKIYWTDVTIKLIARAFPNGSSVEVIAHNNVETPDGIAVDYVGRNLYWTDKGTRKIEVARLDGSFRRSLIITSIDYPRAIILDIAERKMYWSDWGSSPKIEQNNMDGSARTILVSSGLMWVNSLAMDYQNRLLYWCDAALDRIERVDLQGNNRVLILNLALDLLHPFGLALFGDALFWSDWHYQSVHKYNMTTSRNEVVFRGMGKPMELHIYDQAKYSFGSTSCSQLNGGCSNLCLPNPQGHQCFCPEGVQLQPDDPKTCQGVNRCPMLTAPAYGSLAPCANLPGHSCHFSCDSGYSLTGSTTRICSSSGIWSGTPPQCNAVTCVPLSIPQNAILLTISCGTAIGSNCVFCCQSGYGSSQGNVTRTCLHTGQWGGSPISCTDVSPPTFHASCPASPLLVYAERGLFSAQVNWSEPVATDNSGDPPTVTPNYQPPQRFSQGIHIIIYTAEDQSGNKATCNFTIDVQVINCTSLINPGGLLRMSSCSNHYGAQCNFSCTIGYRLNGSSTVTCVAPGDRPPASWDSHLPSCDAITCPALLAPSYGFRQICSGTTIEYYNTVCDFSCKVGFNEYGSSSRQCQADGTWSGQDFICIAHSCGPVNIPPGAIMLTDPCGKTYGSSCVLGCLSGYASVVGNVTTTCLQSGQWSGNAINCTDILAPTFGATCPSSPLVAYAERGLFSAEVNWIEPLATDNSGILPTTSSNHKPFDRFSQGTHVITYTTSDQLGNKAICAFIIDVRVINCTSLTVNQALPLRMSYCGNHFGVKCNFSCTIGYRLNGSSTVSCVAAGNKPPGYWDNPLPSCEVIRCLSLPVPSQGVRRGCSDIPSQPYDTHCNFSCNVGYNLTGSLVRRCLENGTWSGQTSYCQAVRCPPLQRLANGVKTGCTNLVSEPYNTQCNFSCNDGFYLIGSSVRQCRENGTWSGESPFCQATLCSPPCLLISNTSDILAVDYKTAAVRSIISGLTRAVAIDVHFSLGFIFWSDVTEQNIKRFRIDAASTNTIITGIGVCDGLAVDWRALELYWTDTTNDTISVSDLDGNNQRSLISWGIDQPRAINLDLDSGLMIWTDWGANPKIERALLNGSQRLAIVTTNLYWPNGIELDRGNKRIVWVDAGYDTVESVDYSGNNRKLLYQQQHLHPFDVALIPPFLFFTDWVTLKEAHQLDAATGSVLRSIGINGGQPMGIVPYDSSRQPIAPNHCTVNNGGCSHFCVVKSSGYECVCPTGLTVRQDGKTCEDKVKKFLLFADADDQSTKRISLDVSYFVPQTLFNHLGNQRPIALDYDPVEERVYWSDIAQGRILSALSNATSVNVLFRCNVESPDGLAIDHVGRNIYWTDTGTNRIEVARLHGGRRKLLIKDGLDEPRAILLDERNGMMYWTDWGANPKIEQAGMDGSARQAIVTGNLIWPNGLTIDRKTNRLFWVDAKLDKIEVLDLNGGQRQLVMSSVANIHPYGLAVYQDMLYWTDWNSKSISRFNLSSRNQEIVVNGLQKPMDIHVVDPALIPSGSHACAQNNGRCSDLCLLNPGEYQCSCPTGIQLKPDGKSCDYDLFHKITSDKFIIFAEADTGEIYKVPLEIPDTPCYPLGINRNISRPVAVDYDPLEGKVYWTDVTFKLVASSFPNGSSVEVIADNNLDTPGGLAVDYIGRNLYWTDEGTSRIEVARLDGSSRRGLITSSIEKPRAILLDIAARKMYWGSRGSSSKIEQANMDGSNRTTLVSLRLAWVNSLAMDYQSGLLYWCDAQLHRIERVDLKGNNRALMLDLSLDMRPFGLVLHSNVLYWSDWNSHSIHKYNMTSSVTEIVVRGMGAIMELYSYDRTEIFNGSTKCSQSNGGCSHLCLPNPHGFQCSCPEGVQLNAADLFICQGVNRCPHLSAPFQGHLDTCSDLPGKTCRFSCDVGYLLSGSVTRTCNSNGTWTGIQPQCNAVTCPALAILTNGTKNNCTGITVEYFDTVCQFSCYSGYTGMGSSSRRCLEDGTWSGQDFNCTDKTPPSFNGTCPNNMVFYATECSSRALLTWTEPIAIDNSEHVSISYPGIRPPVNLSIGLYNVMYSAIDSSGNRANCTFIVQVLARKSCPVLQPPNNGSITFLSCGYLFGSQASFACDTGYRVAGSPLRSCRGDGTWSGNLTTCNTITCPSLTIPARATLLTVSCGNAYGSTCVFGCQSAYASVEGNVTRTCLQTGLWSGNPINCTDVLPPTFNDTCPTSPLLVYAERSMYSAQVNWNEPVATDNLGHAPSLTSNYKPPQRFSEGTHVITYTAVDQSGNMANCTFAVKVLVINCTSLTVNSGGALGMSNCGNHFGAQCNFTCTIGHRLNGSSTVTCVAPGNRPPGAWDNHLPSCQAITCPPLTIPARATLLTVSCGNTYGSKCVFGCQSGFGSVEANVTRTCLQTGQWSGNPIDCTDVFPPTLNDTCPTSPLLVYAERCIYSAQVNWTEPVATDNSGHAPSLTSNYKPPQRFSQGTHVITYTAIDQSGNMANCTFAVEVLVINCTSLTVNSGGALKMSNCSNHFGAQCNFTCAIGHRLNGSSTVTCVAPGNKPPGAWDNPLPSCQAITCPPLTIPVRATLLTVSCGDTYGSTCVFGCQSGYASADGSVTRTCLQNGQWSGNPINCTDVLPPTFNDTCPTNPLLMYAERGIYSAQVNWTEPVATDNSGDAPSLTSNYKPPQRFSQGTHVITYTAVDPSGNMANCTFAVEVLVINCTSLTVNPGGALRMSNCGNHFGAQCNFTCAIGHRLNGSSTVACVAPSNEPPGVWDNPLPSCQVIRCSSLLVPTNGVKTGCTNNTSEPYDTHCSFSCNVGYNLVGSSLRRCLVNGTWSGETSYCQVITCGPLVLPNDGVLHLSPSSCLTSSLYGQTCTFTCRRPGYVLEGTSTRVCGNKGQWNGSNNTNCSDNTPPSFDDTCPNNTVFYTTECSSWALPSWIEPMATDNSGHVSISYPAIRPHVNLSTGLYNVLYSAIDSSGNRANCTFIVQVEIKSCPVLQPPIYGSISLSCGYSFGSQASLTCNTGYRMAGSSLRSCRADRTWSGNVTTCNIVKCPSIKAPSHGMVFPSTCQTPSGVNYKTECVFTCNDTVGFQLEGEQNVSCLESGTWSNDATNTICKDVQAPNITCPPNMDNISTDPGQSYANVKWQLPDYADNSNEPLTLIGLKPPRMIDVGKRYITYKVTDKSGLSGSCEFFIHVKDLEPPKIANCPDGVYKTTEKKWTKIFFPEVPVTDNVGVHSHTTSRPNGSEFTWGEHNVTYTASDIAGNTAQCNFHVIIAAKPCDELRTPQNGAKSCDTWLGGGKFCTLYCNVGFDFANKPPEFYFCDASANWSPENTVPDCSRKRQAKTLLALEYHYLADQCTEEMHESIARNFIALYTLYLGTVGDCDGNEECTIANVDVECGDQSGARRRRDIANSEQASKVPLTVKFNVKVPLPSNASMVGLNQTTQQISSNILASLKEANLTLNINGVVLEYDPSKPPVVHIDGLVCDKGQVLKGTECVNCPLGYFFNTTGCQACAVDHYQDKEAQNDCATCPSERSTFGKTGSKESKDCQEISNTSGTGKQGVPAKILYPVITLGFVVVISVIIVTIFCLRRRRLDGRRPAANARTQNYGAERDVGHHNPVFGQTSNEPEYMEIDAIQRPVPQPDVGFRNPHFDPGDHYQPLDNAIGRPDNVYGRLNLTGVHSQSEV